MTDLVCPSCKVNALMANSTGETLTCANCKKQIGLYNKEKYRLVEHWVFP